jgi:YD repeat-containing protein
LVGTLRRRPCLSAQDSLGGTPTYAYNGAGQLASESFSDTSGDAARVNLSYDLAGNLTQTQRYSNTAGTTQVGTTNETYTAAGQVTSITQQIVQGATVTTIDGFGYTYDDAGQLTSETENGVTIGTYTYDATGQLTGTGSSTYTYDANGNPTASGDVIGANNQLLSDGTWNYTYDNVGNLIQKVNIATGEKWTYVYDDMNHLISAADATSGGTTISSATYKYDVFGNRIEEDIYTPASGTVVTRYAYDGWKDGANACGQTDSTTGNEN